MMSKLYVGNLPNEISENKLRQLFTERGVSATNVLLKRGGYAFIDCSNATDIDKAIEELNGCSFYGNNIVVEPSVAGAGPKRAILETRVRVSGFPVGASDEELEELLQTVGEVDKFEKYASRDGQTQVVHVAFHTADGAREAAQKLNGNTLQGASLRVERLVDKKTKPSRGGARGRSNGVSQKGPDFPLRMLVFSEMVGAIIGRQGATIKQITQDTRARVDVHRKDGSGALEKAITIYGNPENCSKACKRILQVMREEAENTNRSNMDIPLKILAHNNLIGRIIGKGGVSIKKVMEDTNSKITVSSISDITSYNMERVITIKGSLDDIVQAEGVVSQKLRHSYENDLQAYSPQMNMFPGINPMAMMSNNGFNGGMGNGMYGSANGMGNGMYGQQQQMGSYPPMFPGQGMQQAIKEEVVCLYIPNTAVGAVIGTKGSNIRNLIRFSNASIKIAPLEAENGVCEEMEMPERRVTIVGTPEAQWKAQFLIFDKIREDVYGVSIEDVRLTLEMIVPSAQVGRIIGKGGNNVRDLQRQTGALIKIPQQGLNGSEETEIHINGSFYALQSAQRRVRAILDKAAMSMNRKSSPFNYFRNRYY